MSADFALRLATASDVPALVALVNVAYRGESSRAGWATEADLLGGIRIDADRLATEMATDGNVVLVHEEDGDIIACVHLERQGKHSYLGMLTTKPTLQAKGIGRRMLGSAEAWAAEHWQSQELAHLALSSEPAKPKPASATPRARPRRGIVFIFPN